jgi:hypothetical protein
MFNAVLWQCTSYIQIPYLDGMHACSLLCYVEAKRQRRNSLRTTVVGELRINSLVALKVWSQMLANLQESM